MSAGEAACAGSCRFPRMALAFQCRLYFSSSRLCNAFPCTFASAFCAKRTANFYAAAATSSRSLR